MSNHLFDAFQNSVRPEAVFMETPDGRRLTYVDALEMAARMANALQQRGVVAGNRVAVQVGKCPEAIMLYLACVEAGAVFVPMNTAYTMAEVEYLVGDAQPRVLVVSPERGDEMKALGARSGIAVETMEEGLTSLLDGAGTAEFVPVSRQPDDLAAILYTSGTTGTPKGAMLTHDNLLSNAQTLKAEWQFSASDRLIHALPIFHTHGLFVATNVTLLAGSSMWFLPKFDADQIVDLFASSTTLMGVPTFYVRLAEHEGVTRESVARMRLFISGSAPLLAETHARFSRRTGKDILERYGMTETNMITSNPYSGRRVPGTVGHPLPGVDVRIADPSSGAPLAQGEIGVIEVKGPNVFAGYWHNPEKTKAEFRADGFFITGDLGRFDEEGYLHIVGRSKDLVITGGFNVYPKEVELELDQISGVAESAVFGVPHPDLGEGVTAAIVLDGSGEVSERQVIELLQPRLARFKQPKRVIILDALPRNAMGKVQKNLLREQYAGLYAS